LSVFDRPARAQRLRGRDALSRGHGARGAPLGGGGSARDDPGGRLRAARVPDGVLGAGLPVVGDPEDVGPAPGRAVDPVDARGADRVARGVPAAAAAAPRAGAESAREERMIAAPLLPASAVGSGLGLTLLLGLRRRSSAGDPAARAVLLLSIAAALAALLAVPAAPS